MLVGCSFEMENRIKEKLEKIAEEEHRTLSAQIRMILENWLEEKK